MRGGLFFYVSYNFENYNQFDYSYQNIQIHKYNPLICLVPRFTSLNQYKGGTAAAAPVIKVTWISPSPEVIVPQNYQYVHIKFIAARKSTSARVVSQVGVQFAASVGGRLMELTSGVEPPTSSLPKARYTLKNPHFMRFLRGLFADKNYGFSASTFLSQ